MESYKILKWVNGLVITGSRHYGTRRRLYLSDASVESIRADIGGPDLIGSEWKPFGGLNWAYGQHVVDLINLHGTHHNVLQWRKKYPGISEKRFDDDEFIADVLKTVKIPDGRAAFDPLNRRMPYTLALTAIPVLVLLGWKRFTCVVLAGIIASESYEPLLIPDPLVCGSSIMLYALYAALLSHGLLLWPKSYTDFIPFFGQGWAIFDLVASHVLNPPNWFTGEPIPPTWENPLNYLDSTSVVHSGHYWGLLSGFAAVYLTRKI